MAAAPYLNSELIVSIQTLGRFEVIVRGRPAILVGGGAGRHQLARMLAYLVTNRDQLVSRQDLAVIAGGRTQERQRFRYVVTGAIDMLEGWGLQAALSVNRDVMMLRSHPSWCTDTDHLADLFEAAEASLSQGDASAAIVLLEQARGLCRGAYRNLGAKAHTVQKLLKKSLNTTRCRS